MQIPTPLFFRQRLDFDEAIGQIKTIISEYNSLIKFQRTKKYKELSRSNFEEYKIRDLAIYDRSFDLLETLVQLLNASGKTVKITRRIISLDA